MLISISNSYFIEFFEINIGQYTFFKFKYFFLQQNKAKKEQKMHSTN